MSQKEKLSLIENRYIKLVTVDWKAILKEEEIEDTYKFWSKAYSYKKGAEKFVFRELAIYCLTTLSLPSSNAVVGRVFSIMNAIKTKLRNKMCGELLDAILRMKIRFYVNKICCNGFQATKDTIKDFTASVMYPHKYDFELDEENLTEIEKKVYDVMADFKVSCIHITE